MNHGRTFTNTTDNELPIDPGQQSLQVGVMGWVFAHHRVLYRNANSVSDESRNCIEPAISIVAKVVLVFQINNEFSVARGRNLSIPALKSERIAGIGARQNHGARELIATESCCLVQRAAVGWAHAGY
jgi:hypothetical protein